MLIPYAIMGMLLGLACIPIYNAYERRKYRKNEMGRIVTGCHSCPYSRLCMIPCEPMAKRAGWQ